MAGSRSGCLSGNSLGAQPHARPSSGIARSKKGCHAVRTVSSAGLRRSCAAGVVTAKDSGKTAKAVRTQSQPISRSSSVGSFASTGGREHMSGRPVLRDGGGLRADAWAEVVKAPLGSSSHEVSSWARIRPQTAGSYTGLSNMTRSQNAKAEKEEQILESEFMSPTQPQRHRSRIIKDPAELGVELVEREEFEEDLKLTHERLEELGRRIRLDDVVDTKTKKELERERQRAEELRKRAEHERHLREQAKEAQNPKKRVALQVEQQREFGDHDLIDQVPMVLHETPGADGPARIPLVNIRLIQARSLGLNFGSLSFDSIYKLACKAEKRAAWEENAFGADRERMHNHVRLNRISGGDSLNSRTKMAMQSKLSQQESRNEQRQQQALRRRRQLQEDRTMRHLENMRSHWSLNDGLCCSADTAKALREIKDAAAEYADSGRQDERRSLRPYHKIVCDAPSQDCRSSPDSSPGQWSNGRGHSVTEDSLENGKNVGHKSTRWTIVRSVFCVLWLLLLVRRRHWAADSMRKYLEQIVVFKTINETVRKLNARVRKLQNVTRAFIARKRVWGDQTSRLWMHYEDLYLANHAKAVEAILSADEGQKLTTEKDSPKRSASYVEAAGEWWKSLRIPPTSRKFALGRWYTTQLRRKVQTQTGWLLTVSMAQHEDKDLQNWFRLCGLQSSSQSQEVDRSPVMPQKPRKKLKEYLAIGEQDLLELICTSAQDLREVHPFQDHPANKPMPPDRPTSGGASGGRQRQTLGRGTLELGTVFGVWSGEKVAHQNFSELHRVDVDELFRRFTPRLRQIHDATGSVDGDAEELP